MSREALKAGLENLVPDIVEQTRALLLGPTPDHIKAKLIIDLCDRLGLPKEKHMTLRNQTSFSLLDRDDMMSIRDAIQLEKASSMSDL